MPARINRAKPRLAVIQVALLAAALVPFQARAQFNATQPVSFSAAAINLIAFAGAPSLTVNTAVAGSAPTVVTNTVATWAVTTNQNGAKITGRIPTNMPAGVTLSVSLVAPAGGSVSAGYQPLSTVSVDLVTGLSRVAQGGMVVSYQLAATPAAGVVATANRVVTYTITGGT